MNFPLHPDLRKYCGIDLSQLFPDKDVEGADDLVVGRWMRNTMGLSPSPYSLVQSSDQKRKRGSLQGNTQPNGNAPKWVDNVPRLKSDLEALMELTCFEDPPRIPVRPTSSEATYIVGDAYGSGFGSSSWTAGEEKIGATYGAWKKAVTDHMSSIFRETANLVISIQNKVKEGTIK